MGFETTLEEVASDTTVAGPHKDGDPMVQVEPPKNPPSIPSGHHDFTDGEAGLLMVAAGERVCLDPEISHVDHSITVTHNYLDMVDRPRYRVEVGDVPQRLMMVHDHNCQT